MVDFKNIRDTVLGTLGNVAEKTKDLADKAVDKAKDVSRIAKLNLELGNEKQITEKAFSEIGKLYYETRKDSPDGFFVQLCDEITLAKENIERIQAEIDAIKAGEDDDCACDCNCDCGIDVEITEVSDDELVKSEPVQEGGTCCCGGGDEPKDEPQA